MRIEDISVSQLENALKDPSVLSSLRTMTPVLANMTDQEFLQCSNSVIHRLSQFHDKYGDLKGDEIMKMNSN